MIPSLDLMPWASGVAGAVFAGALLVGQVGQAAEVIDGDTIVLAGQHVRIFGIDAPERKQTCLRVGGEWPCGEVARRRMIELVDGKNVRCDPVDTDRYGRAVAVCRAGDVDIADAMVKSGFALDYERYSRGRYAATESAARAARRGLWSGTFQNPWDWRRRK